jgi:predicted permease
VPALRAVLDPWVAGAAVGMAVVGTLALTLPGLRGGNAGGRTAWAGRGQSVGARGIRWLVAIELALATVLCLGAGLTTRSAEKMLAVDVGLEDQGLLVLYFGDVWDRPEEEQVAYFRQVLDAVETVPGVGSAALIDYLPFLQEDDFASIYFLDRSFQPVRDQREEWRRVSHGLFETAGMRFVQGRSLTADEFVDRPRTAVVNEAFADKHYPGGGAVGQYLSTHDPDYQDLEIVGVVADVRTYGPTEPAPPTLYVPLQGSPRGTTGMYVRAEGGNPWALAEPVREAIWSVDPSQPADGLATMTELVSAWVAIPRTIRTLVSGVATLALFLAAVGVFGVVGYAVRRRMPEFGVRLALGASPGRLRRDVLRGALPLVALGLGGGVLVGWLAAGAAGAVLFGVEPLDPISLAVAVSAMAGAAFLATWIPARRASRVDPTRAIRAE